jgi:hypothetical protein
VLARPAGSDVVERGVRRGVHESGKFAFMGIIEAPLTSAGRRFGLNRPIFTVEPEVSAD